MIHVIIVDDDPQFRQNRRAVLEGLGDCIVVGESDTPTDVIEMAQTLHPDIVLLNGDIPDNDAFETIWLLRYSVPSVGIIVLTQFPDEEQLFQCIRAGANAYKERAICPAVLLETVRRVRAGEFLFSWCSS